ncbi:MobF family relaxase [Streptomyces yerevanensis]|uniref:MobF family relaxase n=1 Tax=Streptomyces yerevanensis TaxID=66378 RepID=UPI000998E3D8|nr:MobF family relaxase [Streptomyces yerevanensis]
MTMDIALITAGQMYRYYLRQVVVGDGRRPARTPLAKAQEEAGVPAGQWMGRGLAALGLAAGDVVTEAQLRNLFGERGRHPHADLIEADQLAAGKSPKAAWKAGALGRRVKVTGADLVLRPQPTVYLLWALGDDETRRVIEAAHERAIARVLEWIEDQVAVIRFGKDGIYQVRPPDGLVAARFRHYEARSGMPLLHDHLMLSVKGQRLDGKWGSVHSEVLFENTVAASALYNEIVMAEVCEALGPASEPRTVTAGRRPVMEIAGVPHELIRWISQRSDQIAACRADLEHEYVTAVDDDGNLKFAPEVSEQARAKLNRIAAKMTRPPKQQTRPLAQLRAWWKTSAILTSGVAVDVINSLLEHARAAAAAIRARVAAVVDVALAVVDVTAMVFVMNKDGFFHRRHLLAEARRHLALVLRGRRRELGLDEKIVDAAIATHCLDISEPKTLRGRMPAYRFYTARWPLTDPPTRRRPPDAEPEADHRPPPSAPATRTRPACPWNRRSGTIPRVPLLYDRVVIASTVLGARLRAARRTGRALYDDVVVHQQAAMPEQLLLFAQEQPPPAVDLAALRTDLEALELTAEQLGYLSRAGQHLAALRKDANRRAHRAATGSAPGAQDAADAHRQDEASAPRAHREDDQRAHQPHQPGPGQSPGARQ